MAEAEFNSQGRLATPLVLGLHEIGGVSYAKSVIADPATGQPRDLDQPTVVEQLDCSPAVASLDAVGQFVEFDLAGYGGLSLQIAIAGTATLQFYHRENTAAGWLTANVRQTNVGSVSFDGMTNSISASGGFELVKQHRFVKVEVTAIAGGAVDIWASKIKDGRQLNPVINGPRPHGGTVGGNPLRSAGRALSALMTPVSTGAVHDLITTLVGALVVRRNSIPESEWSYAAAAGGIANSTAAVTIKTAAAAGLRNYLTSMQITHGTLGADTEIVIRNGAGGTVLWRGTLATTSGQMTMVFDDPLASSAATLLEVALGSAVTGSVYVSAQGYVAP